METYKIHPVTLMLMPFVALVLMAYPFAYVLHPIAILPGSFVLGLVFAVLYSGDEYIRSSATAGGFAIVMVWFAFGYIGGRQLMLPFIPFLPVAVVFHVGGTFTYPAARSVAVKFAMAVLGETRFEKYLTYYKNLNSIIYKKF